MGTIWSQEVGIEPSVPLSNSSTTAKGYLIAIGTPSY